MINAREVGVVAVREIRRNIGSAKGIAMLALFFVGGLVPAVMRVIVKRWAASLGGAIPEEQQQKIYEMALTQQHGGDEGLVKYLAGAPPILYYLFEGTLMFLPLVILLIGFDQIAGEVQHRTLRFSAARAHRASLVVGKALGIWGVMATMILLLHLTVWVLVLVQGGQAPGLVLTWGARFWIYSAIAAGAYVGFTALMSAMVKTPIVALFIGIGVGATIWVAFKILGLFPSTEAVRWIFPNRYEMLLYSPEPGKIASGMGMLVAWGAACVAGASAIVARRDI